MRWMYTTEPTRDLHEILHDFVSDSREKGHRGSEFSTRSLSGGCGAINQMKGRSSVAGSPTNESVPDD